MQLISKLGLLGALALALLPSSNATCAISGYGVFFGDYSNYNSTSRLVGRDWWRYDQTNAWNLKFDACVASCSQNVVINTAMETVWNAFYIAVNGRYLLSDYTWSPTPALWDINVDFSNPSTCPANTLLINSTTPIAKNSNQKFFSGKYNTGAVVANSGYHQPIYQIAFPYWKCPVSGNALSNINYVQIADTMPAVSGRNTAMCGSSYTDMTVAVTRLCASNIRGDPQFMGLRGQDYQVHGIDGGVYNLISAPKLSVTSRFVWLDGPRACPTMPSTGKKSLACWSHKGSYLENIAILNQNNLRVLIQSGPASSGLNAVTVNNKAIQIGESIQLDSQGSEWLHFNSTHEVTLQVGVFNIEVENSDGFVNLRQVVVKAADWQALRDDETHGLLGQTWRNTRSKTVIEGRVDDYLVESGDLFDTMFMYNRFKTTQE